MTESGLYQCIFKNKKTIARAVVFFVFIYEGTGKM